MIDCKDNKTNCTDIDELLNYLELDRNQVNYSEAVHQKFPIRVPFSFIDRMEKNNPQDPLLLQVLPQENELNSSKHYAYDPLNESGFIDRYGLIQKYQARLLMMPTSACGIHCRYCFRRYFPYQEQAINKQNLANQIAQIANNTAIKEVILSGGDPLTLNNKKLSEILNRLEELAHIKYLRIHTRQLIVEPNRIDPELILLFSNLQKPLSIVFHSNHANELNQTVEQKLKQLKLENIQLLNQSVLLKGVNDSVTTLVNLSERLIQCGVLPYYLHQLDKVIGTEHFEVSDTKAIELLEELKKKLPGYLVPKLVKEVPGEAYKKGL